MRALACLLPVLLCLGCPGGGTDLGDGLVVTDLVIGEGELVEPGASIKAHLVGTLPDGTEILNTHAIGNSNVMSLADNGGMQGWIRGIPGMRVGGKRRLQIPWQLGYGEQGTPTVPPKTDLVYVVEVLEVLRPRKPTKQE